MLPGVVLLAKLLFKLSEPHLVISEAGGEAESHQGGEGDEKLHVSVLVGHWARYLQASQPGLISPTL